MKRHNKIIFDSEVAEIQLIYKSKVKPSDRPQITGAADAAALFRKNWNENTLELQEEFKVMYLNRAHRVLAIYTVSSGGMTGTVADCRLILAAALRLGATSFLLCHNHPSGNLQPSKADKELTEKIRQAAALMDMVLLDHIILTPTDYVCFGSI